MIVSFLFPTQALYSGGVAVLFEMANGLARRDHDVHVIHGPAWPGRVDSVEEVAWFTFDPRVRHHFADSLDDPSLPEADVILSPDAPRRLGLPAAVVQGYGMMSSEWEMRTLRARCPKLCVATWLVDVGVRCGAPPEQMLHVPLGLDHDLFRPGAPQDERHYDVCVLYGRSHPAKGWPDARRALESLRSARPDLRAVAFSLPPAGPDLPGWVTFHRDPDRRDLARSIYGQAKVFLQPSRFEGFGLTAVEAMGCGCALVTTDNGGSRDYAVPGETAEVVPVGAIDEMAAAVAGLLDDDERRTRVAGAGSDLVRRFRWDRSAEVLEAHLERYVAEPDRFQRPPRPEAEVPPLPASAAAMALPRRSAG